VAQVQTITALAVLMEYQVFLIQLLTTAEGEAVRLLLVFAQALTVVQAVEVPDKLQQVRLAVLQLVGKVITAVLTQRPRRLVLEAAAAPVP
jgi:hypothetical protein